MSFSDRQHVKHDTVLMLKARGDAGNDSFEKVLSPHGLRTLYLPVLGFTFVNADRLREKLARSGEYSGLVFTSQRAVEAVTKACTESDPSTTEESFVSESDPSTTEESFVSGIVNAWKSKPVFVVGESTEKFACDLGLTVQGSEAGNAENLLPFITSAIQDDRSRPVLFPCGNLRRETLPQGLRSAGFQVDEVTVYETSAKPGIEDGLRKILLHEGCPEIVCFFSPSGVRYTHPALVNLNLMENVKMISMGPSTTKAMAELGLPPAAQAEKPTAESLAAAVLRARGK